MLHLSFSNNFLLLLFLLKYCKSLKPIQKRLLNTVSSFQKRTPPLYHKFFRKKKIVSHTNCASTI